MKYRKNLGRRKSARLFKRTARRTKKANIVRAVMRGGIRF